MSTSSLGTTLDAVQAGLAARPGLADVNVFSGPVSIEEAGQECIAFGDARLNEEAMAMGGNRWEVWTIDGELRVVKTWEGSTEETIKAARDRALELFAEIETYLNDTYTGDLPDVEVSSGELQQLIGGEGRVCRLIFTLQMKDEKNS